ncbi:hypothetical protein Afer_0247 [Acidimicrobium ferrooxidans DSM 10331]|uniref:Uncharacterized protein n=1 Tax=Acidimicrobium ferrooxidans (strain DSM 10331 / JCM 15462 / NBRC 103882 / ICP) TaxID=525909 RepID=C7M2H2_ACIFD|nr:hypothetical protein Afer_0247 [Acidimicrobium ferrooxidans DSM 10331]
MTDELRPRWLGGGDWWLPLAEVSELIRRLSAVLIDLARVCADARLPDVLVRASFECSRVLGGHAGELAHLDLHPQPDLLQPVALDGNDAFAALRDRLVEIAPTEEALDVDRWRETLRVGFDELELVARGLGSSSGTGQTNLAAWARELGSSLATWREQLGIDGSVGTNGRDR